MNNVTLGETEYKLSNSLDGVEQYLYKSYLDDLDRCLPTEKKDINFENLKDLSTKVNESTRFVKLTRLVLDKKKDYKHILVSVYKSIYNAKSSFVMLINGKKDSVDFYLGVKSNGDVSTSQTILKNALVGNFPGIEIAPVREEALQNEILSTFSGMNFSSLVSAIPALRTDSESSFVQGIEKFIDSMSGKTYSMILVADAISRHNLDINRQALENIRTQLSPFVGSTYTYGESLSDSVNRSFSESVGNSITNSVSNSIANTIGNSFTESDSESSSQGENSGRSSGYSSGTSNGSSIGHTSGSSNTVSDSASTTVGAQTGILSSLFRGFGFSASETISTSSSQTTSQGHTSSISNSSFNSSTYGTTVGAFKSRSNSHSSSQGLSKSQSISQSDNKGWGKNENFSLTKAESHSESENSSVQIKLEDFRIKRLMDRIKDQLDRYDRCADLGMWNCCTYFLSETPDVSAVAASLYQSIICGKKSSVENDHIIYFDDYKTQFIKPYLACFEHPNYRGITPGALISSDELSIAAGIPGKSLMGLPVMNCAAFGRSVSTVASTTDSESKMNLGKIFHMNHEEPGNVDLDYNSLSSHVFVTGSTGSGKSNTVYQLLNECRKQGVPFLVVEPAKGEYKNVFGHYSDVSVYGSNPNLTKLLKINPFQFSAGTHVLEHIDRLVEIFNVCWPMYAAMPAVLKDAVIKSYEDAGWNMMTSENTNGNNYPSFVDVARNIKLIIDASEYDAETKGGYKGSLLTRLNSLTTGLNSLIFANDSISDAELFDENAIVDLSRVGSQETKSLLMGVLVLKLQEYRMSQGGMNEMLRHITVIEEAHNLLKRVSTEQSTESANLIGKSVEMLTNSIAEMRTYGEGFVIADQAPALLDMAAIRNTNTKIIMRLPDQGDRELVGKSINLNDEQISELAKLPRGVAAVYQNEWAEAVLCKISKFEPVKRNTTKPETTSFDKDSYGKIKIRIATAAMSKQTYKNFDIAEDLKKTNISSRSRAAVLEFLKSDRTAPDFCEMAPVMAELFSSTYSQMKLSFATGKNNFSLWVNNIVLFLKKDIYSVEMDFQLRRDVIQSLIMQLIVFEDNNPKLYSNLMNGLEPDWGLNA